MKTINANIRNNNRNCSGKGVNSTRISNINSNTNATRNHGMCNQRTRGISNNNMCNNSNINKKNQQSL